MLRTIKRIKEFVIKRKVVSRENGLCKYHSHSAPTHLIVQEYEVHLDENEGHSRSRRECQHDIVTFGILFQLEVLAEFQSRVNHRADAERHGAHSQIEATVVLDRTYRIHMRVSGLRRIAITAGAA